MEITETMENCMKLHSSIMGKLMEMKVPPDTAQVFTQEILHLVMTSPVATEEVREFYTSLPKDL